VNWEWWNQFQYLIFSALLYLRGLTGDWGMAIILVTLAIRLILLPLTWKQTKSMVELQRIQPKIKELQVKYKDDKEKLQEETLKFYQENKVNPFGGCLPLLLQMPVLFALYGVLGARPPAFMLNYLSHPHPGFPHGETGTFYWLIPDISKTPQSLWDVHHPLVVLPYVLLVILFGVSVWLPQALMPGDKQQKMMGGYMAIIMLWFGWISPAGVLLYWDVSSILGVAQQQVTMSMTKREVAAEAPQVAGQGKKAARGAVAGKKPSNKKPNNS
jgi:YidC/Oxa1 family membrane protein insertase